ILAELGFNLAPLIAGAGILGVALGFGAQSLVADFLSGVFILMEDQYGVGDVVDVGDATGTVEEVQLRTTQIRSVDGVLWFVRNGEIMRVGNMSQDWSRTVLDIGIAYAADIPRAKAAMAEVGVKFAADPDHADSVLAVPEVWGVEDLAADSVVLRMVVKTHPGTQWSAARELRERIKLAFDEQGIEIPFQQRTVWLRREPGDEANAGSSVDEQLDLRTESRSD
nr:mechanosensitive ion channel family protein [Actinomycetes bacterium]